MKWYIFDPHSDQTYSFKTIQEVEAFLLSEFPDKDTAIIWHSSKTG